MSCTQVANNFTVYKRNGSVYLVQIRGMPRVNVMHFVTQACLYTPKMKGEITMNDALEKFQKTVSPEISLDNSESLTEKLIEEISKLKAEVGE